MEREEGSGERRPVLRILQGPEAGKSFELAGRERVVIGRRASSDFQILDPGISGAHCEVVAAGEGFLLKDAGSSNGTFLNGKQIKETPLADQDVVLIGHSVIQFLHRASAGEALRPGVSSTSDTTVLVRDQWAKGESDIIEKFSTDSVQELVGQAKPHHRTTHLQRALAAIYQIAVVLNETGEVIEKLKKILNIVLGVYRADRGCVVLVAEGGAMYDVACSAHFKGATAQFEVSQTILASCLEEGNSILTLDRPATELFEASQSIGEQQVKSILCVPISTEERRLGALYFDSLSRIGAFNREDLRLLNCVARLVGELLEKHRLSAEAEISREQLRVVLEEAPVGVFALDKSLRYSFWSRHLSGLLGHTPQEVNGKAGLALVVQDPEKVPILVERAERLGSFEGELRCRRKNGTHFLGRLALAPLGGPGDDRLRIIGCLTDISEREKLQGQLVQKQKLAALGLLVAGITHDLRNYITSLYGTAQLAEKFPKYQEQLVKSALTTSTSSIGLIENLLGYVKGGGDKWEEIDLVQLAEVVLSLVETQLRHDDIQIAREFQPVPKLRGVRSYLQDIFLNLILNSRKAMKEGGTLRLRIQPHERGTLRVEVEDTGEGIAADKLPHLFEPFFTQHKETGGTGLGLYMVRQIVEEHGGTVGVRSELGRGTTFSFLFPAIAPPNMDETTQFDKQPTPKIAATREVHLLVGELDADTIRLFQSALGLHSWDLAGETGTLMTLATGSRYDAVFLAAELPGPHPAAEVFRKLREQDARIPLFVMHSGADGLAPDLQRADALLERPIERTELTALIQRVTAPRRA